MDAKKNALKKAKVGTEIGPKKFSKKMSEVDNLETLRKVPTHKRFGK